MPRILLVEDDEDLRPLLVRRLQRNGFEVSTTGDGEQGCALARSELPDVILMDNTLIGSALQGIEAVIRLKADEATRAIPVIMLSASIVADQVKEYFEAGCDDVEIKPVNVPRLLERIHKQLERARVS